VLRKLDCLGPRAVRLRRVQARRLLVAVVACTALLWTVACAGPSVGSADGDSAQLQAEATGPVETSSVGSRGDETSEAMKEAAPTVADELRPVPPERYVLDWAVSPAGAGSVSAAPVCADYEGGAQVTLTAVASKGYSFAYWYGDLSGSSATMTVVMDSDKTLSAHFEPDLSQTETYELVVSVSPAAGGYVEWSPRCSRYKAGTEVTLTCRAEEGYAFAYWGGALSSESSKVSIVMDSDKKVTAYFEALPSPPIRTYVLETRVYPAGAGTVSPPCCNEYVEGEMVTVSATPSEGYSFAFWIGDISGSSVAVTVLMDSDKSVVAYFR